MEWREIPAQRVLEVGHAELLEMFERRAETGVETLYVRHRDSRVFRMARIQPAYAAINSVCYLAEV